MAVSVSAGPALAHHSGAMFDRTKTVTLVGTIKKYDYVNPHAWLDLTVDGGTGAPGPWSVEMEAPIGLRKMGLTPSTLKVGDKVTVRAHPLRDGRMGGSFIDIKLADGTVIGSRVFGAPSPGQAGPAPTPNPPPAPAP
jgi:hypothetical protein